MKRVCQTPAKVIAGLIVTALCAMPQATISARPGVINYIEGNASIDGSPVTGKINGKTFLATGSSLSTDQGKAEVLLTPGVFLRIGSNSELKMISPSLTNTQVELIRGEAIIEADELVKENNIQILDSGATVRLEKTGLYRFTANPPTVTSLDGKAEVIDGDKKISLGKNHEVVLSAQLRPEKINAKSEEDDLYAWSKVRDEYVAAASFSAAKTINNANTYGGYGYGYGFAPGGFGPWGAFGYGPFAPGWFWNPMWSSWGWLPGDGAFFSPFGYGFFSPSYVGYAPVVVTSLQAKPGTTVQVPVNPSHPGTITSATGGKVPILTANGALYRGATPSIGSSSGHWSGTSIRSAAYGGSSSGASSAHVSSGGGGFSGTSSSMSGVSSSSGAHGGGGRR